MYLKSYCLRLCIVYSHISYCTWRTVRCKLTSLYTPILILIQQLFICNECDISSTFTFRNFDEMLFFPLPYMTSVKGPLNRIPLIGGNYLHDCHTNKIQTYMTICIPLRRLLTMKIKHTPRVKIFTCKARRTDVCVFLNFKSNLMMDMPY